MGAVYGPMGFGGGGSGQWVDVSETLYTYNDGGNATWIVEEFDDPEPGQPEQVITRLHYAKNGRAVTYVVGGTQTSGVSDVTYVREFRYDGARQRYLNRMYDDEEYELDDSLVLVSEVWSDYDGDSIYGDYTLSGQTPTNEHSYQPGIGKFDWTTSTLKHYHTDMIGTTRMMTDSDGAADSPATFTAFGVQVGGTAQRYGYAGAHGYQTDDTGNFPFMHVGHRYYNPATGRFLQRDPIGIMGGSNVYAYVGNIPTIAVDPTGTIRWPNTGRIRYGPSPVKTGYRRWTRRLAFRCGRAHVYGVRGALAFGGSVVGAAAAGAVGGRIIDNVVGRANNDYRISDGLADILYRWFSDDGSGYDPWGQ